MISSMEVPWIPFLEKHCHAAARIWSRRPCRFSSEILGIRCAPHVDRIIKKEYSFYKRSFRVNLDALIVGAGPVGLTMAIELARYGVSVRIIDKAPERTDKSKALVIWSRSLELLERAGCSAALVDAGYKVNCVNISAGKKPIARFTLEGVATKYPFGLMIPQSDTERVLDEFLNTLGVTVERSVELT